MPHRYEDKLSHITVQYTYLKSRRINKLQLMCLP